MEFSRLEVAILTLALEILEEKAEVPRPIDSRGFETNTLKTSTEERDHRKLVKRFRVFSAHLPDTY